MADALEALPIPKGIPANVPQPDSDDWLHMMIAMLLQRQPIMDERMRYYSGIHRLPTGSPEYMHGALKSFRRLAQTNYIGLITTAPVERMYVRGFTFGDDGQSDKDAQQIWSYNDMDMQQVTLHTQASIFGLSYALVTPPEEDDPYPSVTVEDPRVSIIYRDPLKPTRALCGLRLWHDDVAGRVLGVLYRPEGAYGYAGPATSTISQMTLEQLKATLIGHGMASSGMELVGFIPNPPGFDEIPMVEYVWRPETGVVPWGECGFDLQVIQDRLNQTVYDRIAISYFQAYRQRYGTGIDTSAGGRKNPQGQAPFRPGVNTFWAAKSEKAKFGEFSTADVTQILEAIRDDISDMAALSKTPAHYLMGKMANISGETLTQAESGLTSKTQLRMNTMGWSHARMMRLCFAFMGDKRATDYDATTLWENPGKELTADLALAGQQWAAIGIPLEVIMTRQGFAQDEIDFSVAKQQQMLEQQQQHEIELAKASAPPAVPGQAKAQGPAASPGVNKKSVAAKNPQPKAPTPATGVKPKPQA